MASPVGAAAPASAARRGALLHALALPSAPPTASAEGRSSRRFPKSFLCDRLVPNSMCCAQSASNAGMNAPSERGTKSEGCATLHTRPPTQNIQAGAPGWGRSERCAPLAIVVPWQWLRNARKLLVELRLWQRLHAFAHGWRSHPRALRRSPSSLRKARITLV